jgi:hypothetical protein
MPFDMSNLYQMAKPKKVKAGRQVRRRAIIIEAIIVVARESWRDGTNPTLWTYEGEMIAALRSGLCLEGFGWQVANHHAVEIVGEALRKAGAKRPAWKEGQPEWTDGGVIRDTRTHCANCEKPLAEGQKTFCSKTCFDALRARQYRADNLDKFDAIERLRTARRAKG